MIPTFPPINDASGRAALFVKALSPGNLMALRLWLRGMPPYERHPLRKYIAEALLDPDSATARAALEAAMLQRDLDEIECQRAETLYLLGPGFRRDRGQVR